MRLRLISLCGLLAACTSGAVTVPSDPVIMEVPQAGTASTAGGDAFTTTIENALAEPTPTGVTAAAGTARRAGSVTGTGAALNDDPINLMQWTLEQQKIDAAIAERELLEARSQLVVVQPGPLPNRSGGGKHRAFRDSKPTTRWASGSMTARPGRGWRASGTAAGSATATRRSGRSWPAAGRTATATASIRTATASPAAGTRRPTARCARAARSGGAAAGSRRKARRGCSAA